MTGEILGHYRIEGKLGAGGMGEVFLALDTVLGRRVAIKVIGGKTPEDAAARRRLLREAQTASALNHPNICVIHEAGEFDGRGYIVMEHVEGRTLSSLIQEEPLPPRDVV